MPSGQQNHTIKTGIKSKKITENSYDMRVKADQKIISFVNWSFVLTLVEILKLERKQWG